LLSSYRSAFCTSKRNVPFSIPYSAAAGGLIQLHLPSSAPLNSSEYGASSVTGSSEGGVAGEYALGPCCGWAAGAGIGPSEIQLPFLTFGQPSADQSTGSSMAGRLSNPKWPVKYGSALSIAW
jgi:hypothetical protein